MYGVWTVKNHFPLLTTAPVLAFPNFKAPFILETDASGAGLSVVLAQRQEDGHVPAGHCSNMRGITASRSLRG